MENDRTINASRNIITGVINKVIALVLPFVSRTVIIYLLGTSFLGVETLFSSILSFLNLAELGLSAAIVYAMYKPIVDKDYDTINALMRYYRALYRKIGMAMLAVGLLILPFITYFIKGEYPESLNIYFLYIIYLVNSVLSYLFAGYRQSILTAFQRNDINNIVYLIINIVVKGGQILLLLIFKNFYVYAIVPIAGTVITNFLNVIITDKLYPQIKCRGELDQEIRRNIQVRIWGLFGTKLNSIVVHSADTIIISSYFGLELTARYGNYYYIMNSISGLLIVLFSSLTAGIGNKMVVDSEKQNKELFNNINFVNSWVVGWFSICFFCLYEPFIRLWIGDELRLGIKFSACMAVYFYIYEIQRTVLTYKDAAGLWHKDWLRPYVSMAVNLISNIVLCRIIGIYGIVISSILAFFISVPWSAKILFNNFFHTSCWEYIFITIKSFARTILVMIPTYILCMIIPDGIFAFACKMGICVVVPNLLFWIVLHRRKEYFYLKDYIVKIVRRLICRI